MAVEAVGSDLVSNNVTTLAFTANWLGMSTLAANQTISLGFPLDVWRPLDKKPMRLAAVEAGTIDG
jgi:hypothetical protein